MSFFGPDTRGQLQSRAAELELEADEEVRRRRLRLGCLLASEYAEYRAELERRRETPETRMQQLRQRVAELEAINARNRQAQCQEATERAFYENTDELRGMDVQKRAYSIARDQVTQMRRRERVNEARAQESFEWDQAMVARAEEERMEARAQMARRREANREYGRQLVEQQQGEEQTRAQQRQERAREQEAEYARWQEAMAPRPRQRQEPIVQPQRRREDVRAQKLRELEEERAAIQAAEEAERQEAQARKAQQEWYAQQLQLQMDRSRARSQRDPGEYEWLRQQQELANAEQDRVAAAQAAASAKLLQECHVDNARLIDQRNASVNARRQAKQEELAEVQADMAAYEAEQARWLAMQREMRVQYSQELTTQTNAIYEQRARERQAAIDEAAREEAERVALNNRIQSELAREREELRRML